MEAIYGSKNGPYMGAVYGSRIRELYTGAIHGSYIWKPYMEVRMSHM